MFSRSYCPLVPCMKRSKTKSNMLWGVIPEGADSRSFLTIKVLTSLCFSLSPIRVLLLGFCLILVCRTPTAPPHIPLGDPEPQIRIILHQSWHKAWPFGSQFTSLMQISFMTSWDLIIQISYVSWHVSNLLTFHSSLRVAERKKCSPLTFLWFFSSCFLNFESHSNLSP